jgi:hypothetical protein
VACNSDGGDLLDEIGDLSYILLAIANMHAAFQIILYHLRRSDMLIHNYADNECTCDQNF